MMGGPKLEGSHTSKAHSRNKDKNTYFNTRNFNYYGRSELNRTGDSGINFNLQNDDNSFEVRVEHDMGLRDDLLQFIHVQATMLEENRDKLKIFI